MPNANPPLGSFRFVDGIGHKVRKPEAIEEAVAGGFHEVLMERWNLVGVNKSQAFSANPVSPATLPATSLGKVQMA